jgi:hypothetical protein
LRDPQVRQQLDGVEPAWTVLTFDTCRHCAWNDATANTRTADRLMTLIWSPALSLFWKALRHTPSALTRPSNVCMLAARGTFRLKHIPQRLLRAVSER